MSSTLRPRWSPTMDRNVGRSSARAWATNRRTIRRPYRCRSFSSGAASGVVEGSGPYAAHPTTLMAPHPRTRTGWRRSIISRVRVSLRTMTETMAARTFTVGEGDDLITCDVRGKAADATADRPALFILGSPMEASYFVALAVLFPDRPAITYDPRGPGRNPRGTTPITPQQHAEDLHRVIEAVGAGPVDVLASSGGGVNVLALVAAHPDDVRRVVAHEPPVAIVMPDRDNVLAAVDDIRAT